MDRSAKDRILNICAELGEDLDSESCRTLREYVKTCQNCEAFVDSVKKTIRLYREYVPSYSEETHKTLFKILRVE